MSPGLVGILGLILLFAALSGGVPIAAALGLVGIGGLCVLLSPEAALIKAGVVSFDIASRYELGVLPLFLFMAHVCFAAGASRDFFDSAAKFAGHKPGGLALASIGACAGFGAISGSSLATVATIGLVALPEMRKQGYSPALATGAIAAGGSIGSLVPPSAALIVFGILTEQSIGRLFTAAIVPAATQALLYMIVIYIICSVKPAMGPRLPRETWAVRIASLRRLWDVGLLILLVIGGIAVGWFSPTEAASVGSVGALALCAGRGKLNLPVLKKALTDTLRTAGMIYAIIIGAIIFSTFVAATGVGQQVADGVAAMHPDKLTVTIVLVLVVLALGMFLDGLALMTLTVPIFMPIISQMGISPIFFGILLVRTMEIGFVHPPVGMNIYIIHNIAKDIPLMKIFKGVIPFLIADLFHVALLVAFPASVLFLPKLLGS
ncbi:MAG: TRAP transporter large permease [Caulobacteraceae bacterium]